MTRAITTAAALCLAAALLPSWIDNTPAFHVNQSVSAHVSQSGSAPNAVDLGSQELRLTPDSPKEAATNHSSAQDSQDSHACTFGDSIDALATGCCQMPAAAPRAFEEYVCLGNPGSRLFIDRICTFPNDPNNPCGQAGPAGCAICWSAPYMKGCQASVNSSQPELCTYAFK
jgi:hypothetical protein